VGEEGEATLGGSWMDTLGRPGGRIWPWPDEDGPIRCHDSNRSSRLAMASREMDVGGGALVRAPDIRHNLKAMDDFVVGRGRRY
jgi:hypothetical protein